MNIPKLRFPGFDGENYKLIALGKYCEINPTNKILPTTFYYIDLESVNDGVLEEVTEINKDAAPSRAQRLLNKGDILYQTVRPYQKNNLHFNLTGNYVASTGYAQLRVENSEYLFQYIHTNKFVDDVMMQCTGTSYPAINSSNLAKINIAIPTLPEQQKIATFLTAVDKRLQLLRRKKEQLEAYKKGMMQKIFSQELRFKDEDGGAFADWEVKELESIATFSKGKGISKSDVINGGQLECIRYGELYTDYSEVIHNVKSRTNLNAKDLVLSVSNDVIIPASGETRIDIATASCVLKSGVALGGDLNIIKSSLNGIFLSYYLNNVLKSTIADLAQGISVVHLYSNQLKKLKINTPSPLEQQKIADLLCAIDASIEKVHQQIESSQVFKKGLLQGMFV